MQRHQRITIFPLVILCPLSIWASSPVDGDWIGGFERPESHVVVHTHFWTTNNVTSGTVDVIDLGDKSMVAGQALDKVELNPSHVHFELPARASALSFEGLVTNDVLSGMVEDRGTKLPFRLDLMARIDPARYTGIYKFGPEHFISINPAPDAPFTALFSFDNLSGQLNFLLPRSETDFVCGSGAKAYPAQATIRFTTNQLGWVTAMQWQPENAPALAGTPIKLQEKDVSFTNGIVTLSGTLVLPPTKGPHPAVVIIDGSGPCVRNDRRTEADFFALNGVAALIYDKRGCGRSTGNWLKSGFDDLAGDALAGLEMLKNRQNINPHQIGLWGTSQGGWLVGLAASRSTDVAFIISVSGPGVTPEEARGYCAEYWMKAAGYPEADVNEARSLSLMAYHCGVTDTGWDKLKVARKTARNKPWYNVNPFLGNEAAGIDTVSQLIWNYNPVPALRKVHCPVLSVYGELDELLPAQKSADIWKTALREAGNQDVVIKVFPHADHGIADPRIGTPLSGYFTLERNWLLKHVAINSD